MPSSSTNFIKAANSILQTYSESALMLEWFASETIRSLSETSRVTDEMLEDVRRVLRGQPQIYDRPDPDDPNDEFVFVVTGKREVLVIERAMAGAAKNRPRFEGMLFEMAFMYLVSLFDAFLQDIMTAALIARPEALRSGKQITIERALSFRKQQDLVEHVAEREVLEITHKNIGEQLEYLNRKFGVTLTKSVVPRGRFEEIYARRNLFAHNNGVVNAVYRERVPQSRLRAGTRIPVTATYWKMVRRDFEVLSKAVHAGLTKKLGQRSGVSRRA